jgi:hypothetical protein
MPASRTGMTTLEAKGAHGMTDPDAVFESIAMGRPSGARDASLT